MQYHIFHIIKYDDMISMGICLSLSYEITVPMNEYIFYVMIALMPQRAAIYVCIFFDEYLRGREPYTWTYILQKLSSSNFFTWCGKLSFHF